MPLARFCSLLAALFLLLSGCDDAPPNTTDPAQSCDGVSCSGHGECAVTASGARLCVCDTGYRAEDLSCVAIIPGDECAGVDCNLGGVCRVEDGQPVCDCGSGYQALGKTTCIPECEDCQGAPLRISARVANGCSAWRPVLHDELSYQTPSAVRVGIQGLALLREHHDQHPIELPLGTPLLEGELVDGLELLNGTTTAIPAGEYRYFRVDLAYGAVELAATAHLSGYPPIPGTLSMDVAGGPHQGSQGLRAQGDVIMTFSGMGQTQSYHAQTAFNCLLSWNAGSIDTSTGRFLVTLPIPDAPLLISPQSTEPISLELRFPMDSAFAWPEVDATGFRDGVFDISLTGTREEPSRLPLCDFFLADRCAPDAEAERVAPSVPIPDSNTAYCADGVQRLDPCPGVAHQAYGQDGNTHHPVSYTVTPDTVFDPTTGLLWQRILEPQQLDWWRARDYCHELELAGRDDWTLPSRNELISVLDLGRQTPSIDTEAFPNTPPGFFWTASPVPFLSLAYGIRFDQGYVYDHDPINQGHVRCVTSVTQNLQPRYRVEQGRVFDLATGLQWQQELLPERLNWLDAVAACQSLVLDGFDDYRLPDAKELQSLVDETRIDPSLDVAAFPNSPGEWLWASTPAADYPQMAWAVSFTDGYSTPAAVTEQYRVRCLR